MTSPRNIAIVLVIFAIPIGVLLFHMTEDNKSEKLDLDISHHLSSYSGERITITGRALNAKEGAIVSGEMEMVIVKGMEKWPDSLYSREVVLSGILTEKTFQDRGPMFATPKGTFYYIEAEAINLKGVDRK